MPGGRGGAGPRSRRQPSAQPQPEESDEAFGSQGYWDERYAACEGQRAEDPTDEWYLTFADLQPLLSGCASPLPAPTGLTVQRPPPGPR